jgi:electron transfer flavoprotein beta subunit
MRIVVLVKQVPCAVGGLSLAADFTLDRVGVRAQLNDADQVAVDQARRIGLERRDVRITAVTVGLAGVVDAVRQALVLGADEGVHVLDDGLHGCDALGTSRVLAAVVDRLGFDLVLCGGASSDSGMSVVPAMVAERLGVPALCFADALQVRQGRVETRRNDGVAVEVLAADLPAVVSVTECCGPPSYPRFAAIVAARHKVVRKWSLADLDVDAAEVGLRGAATAVRAVRSQVGGKPRILVQDDAASAAVRLADFLAGRQFL